MTRDNIYTKFLIEYDKANVTSSYPQLTRYEVAVILDKAYRALIAQKVTGNNPRKAPFEYDNKAISDLKNLINTDTKQLRQSAVLYQNVVSTSLPVDYLYFVSATI